MTQQELAKYTDLAKVMREAADALEHMGKIEWDLSVKLKEWEAANGPRTYIGPNQPPGDLDYDSNPTWNADREFVRDSIETITKAGLEGDPVYSKDIGVLLIDYALDALRFHAIEADRDEQYPGEPWLAILWQADHLEKEYSGEDRWTKRIAGIRTLTAACEYALKTRKDLVADLEALEAESHALWLTETKGKDTLESLIEVRSVEYQAAREKRSLAQDKLDAMDRWAAMVACEQSDEMWT